MHVNSYDLIVLSKKKIFIKSLRCVLYIILFLLSTGSYNISVACDNDGICEPGENESNCVFDCMVAANPKDVKIHFSAGPTNKIIFYKTNGTKQIITDNNQVIDFLKDNLDLSINRFIDDTIPYLIYRSTGNTKDYSNYPDSERYNEWLEYDAHEEWFTHQDGEPQIRDNRLLKKGYNTLMVNPTPEYSNAYSNWTKFYLEQKPDLDGAFFDETAGTINKNLYAWHIVNEEQTVKETINGDKKYIYVQTYYPILTGSAFPTIVSNISDPAQIYSIFGIWSEMNTIFLNDGAAAGANVNVNYYANATVPQQIKDNWKGAMVNILQDTRGKIGGKLMIYNGFSTDLDYDKDFLLYSDGGMIEGMFSIPWRTIAENTKMFSESVWKIQVDKLTDISVNKRKIFLAQSGVTIDDETADEEIRKVAMFCFASYLLGKGDYAYFNFYLMPEATATFIYFDYWGLNIGSALETYHVRDNVSGANIYEREFENALVLVNPSAINVTVALGSSYLTLDGINVENVQLEGKSGIMLLKYTAGVTTTTTSIQPVTTTTVQPATTTTAISGGGGGGGGGNLSTTTTSVQPTTTTTAQSVTTT